MKASKDLERFLDSLKNAESQLDQATAGQQEAEAETWSWRSTATMRWQH